MSDYILITGDKAIFLPSFGAATVVVRPGTLQGSGPETVKKKKVCVLGDESKVSVQGCMYTTLSYPIPGTGTLEIASLAGDQIAKHARTANRAVLLVGRSFTARFMVQNPAKKPTPAGPVPDATPQYSGKGKFTTTNNKVRGV
jgi:hypothetical protein